MSYIYIKEPLTNGKVLLKTSLGDIDIELWSKEAPLACRNFVQLCLERYYDDTIFHRVIRDFIAQGGDPTGTGEGGESIYGHPFKDEFHSRLKFSRRGLVGMANAGQDDNGSQFFFSLGRADDLNKKHTIFGKVTGDTLYNLLRFNDIPTDKEDRPFDPAPKIFKTEVLLNPFDDIVPRVDKGKMDRRKEEKAKSQSRATKNFSLLSFGEEAEEDEEETDVASKSLKIKSSHDVLKEDPKLSSQPAVDASELRGADSRKRGKEEIDDSAEVLGEGEGEEEEGGEGRRERGRGKARRLEEEGELEMEIEDEETRRLRRKEELRQESQQLKRELREAKRRREREKDEEERVREERDEGLPDSVRALRREQEAYKSKKKALGKGGGRENQTLELLSKFKLRLFSARNDTEDDREGGEEETRGEGREEGELEEEGETNWLGHRLTFEEERLAMAKDASIQNEDTFDIYDPRNPLNKRRREESKKQQREKRRRPARTKD